MVVARQALMFRERVPAGQAYVFYIDIRSAGLHYDEYVQRAMTEARALYLRGKVSKIYRDGGRVMVWGSDTLSGRAIEIGADLVVLATHRKSGMGAFWSGSVAPRVSSRLERPLLLVPVPPASDEEP
jgi:heterodisulfide reductase subunit A